MTSAFLSAASSGSPFARRWAARRPLAAEPRGRRSAWRRGAQRTLVALPPTACSGRPPTPGVPPQVPEDHRLVAFLGAVGGPEAGVAEGALTQV